MKSKHTALVIVQADVTRWGEALVPLDAAWSEVPSEDTSGVWPAFKSLVALARPAIALAPRIRGMVARSGWRFPELVDVAA